MVQPKNIVLFVDASGSTSLETLLGSIALLEQLIQENSVLFAYGDSRVAHLEKIPYKSGKTQAEQISDNRKRKLKSLSALSRFRTAHGMTKLPECLDELQTKIPADWKDNHSLLVISDLDISEADLARLPSAATYIVVNQYAPKKILPSNISNSIRCTPADFKRQLLTTINEAVATLN
jgi:hypothetical protein